ncbi:LytTR family transcriptional regulator [Spirosoma sp. KCTC 42546]|uniref:LytR/AlgR family response regulator transcription factor n=1 Tax=Spirosoma sp. KCTC 42546 TaxID=2520506 RepID=UPI0011599488|nr:LytTR family DNA-binding domain-containing protein [Spirosoma sp. KCTC 42546]QDK80538.1 LytTR family transcriptional regulator [Spirosoma sp. KCTC 42546]
MTKPIYLHQNGHVSTYAALKSAQYELRMHLPNTGKIILPMADLMYLQAASNYCWLHWKDGQRILTPRTLKYYEPMLPEAWFVRPHRNCIVNIHYIDRMEYLYPDKGGLLHLHSGEILPVSRRRWVDIKNTYKHMRSQQALPLN